MVKTPQLKEICSMAHDGRRNIEQHVHSSILLRCMLGIPSFGYTDLPFALNVEERDGELEHQNWIFQENLDFRVRGLSEVS
jgi:hypothetical protein